MRPGLLRDIHDLTATNINININPSAVDLIGEWISSDVYHWDGGDSRGGGDRDWIDSDSPLAPVRMDFSPFKSRPSSSSLSCLSIDEHDLKSSNNKHGVSVRTDAHTGMRTQADKENNINHSASYSSYPKSNCQESFTGNKTSHMLTSCYQNSVTTDDGDGDGINAGSNLSVCPVCCSDNYIRRNQLIPCSQCSQQFHTYCVDEISIPYCEKVHRERFIHEHHRDWMCPSCLVAVAVAASVSPPDVMMSLDPVSLFHPTCDEY